MPPAPPSRPAAPSATSAPLAPSAAGASPAAPRRRRAVTGRALVLATVVVLLLVVLASPMSRYFASRTAVGQSAQQLQRDTRQLHQAQQQLQRWGDPGYVQQQARKVLQYAMPGDKVWVVVDHGQRNDIEKTAHEAGSTAPGSWNTRLWSSVQHADARS